MIMQRLMQSPMMENIEKTDDKCGCGQPIGYRLIGDKKAICFDCQQHSALKDFYMTCAQGSTLKGTDYDGCTWQTVFNGNNGKSAKQIHDYSNGDCLRVIIYGQARGTGKTLTGKLIANDYKLSGKSVRYITMSQLQAKMTADGEDAYHVIDEYSSVDLLVLDEIDKYISRTRFYLSAQFSILEERIVRKKSTVLIGNLDGIIREQQTTGNFASDMFDSDRLRLFTPYEYTGASHRSY